MDKDILSLTGIQGCDFVIKIDGKVLGSMSSFKYDTSNKLINMSSLLFGKKESEIKIYQDEETLRNLRNSTVEQYFMNEYGFKAYRKFTGVKFMCQKGELDIDTYKDGKVDYYNEVYSFKYDLVTPLYLIPAETAFEDIPKAIENYKKEEKLRLEKEAKEREKKTIQDQIDYLQSELTYIDKGDIDE